MMTRWKERARVLRKEAYALYIASRDPRIPWYVQFFIGLVIAHTFSPIDLIPDFIPVLGHLDDLLITPLGIFLALKMIPPEVMKEARAQAVRMLQEGKRPMSRTGLVWVIALWVVFIAVILYFIFRTIPI